MTALLKSWPPFVVGEHGELKLNSKDVSRFSAYYFAPVLLFVLVALLELKARIRDPKQKNMKIVNNENERFGRKYYSITAVTPAPKL